MKTTKKRGFLATAGAVLTALALTFGGTAAQADTAQPVPETTDVTITKLAQPETLGETATGEQQDVTGTGIGGVVFEYYLVPGIDLGTNAGQAAAGALTVAEAEGMIDGTPTGAFPATNTPSGVTTATLDRGIYLVKEDPSTVPAGVTASAPFLLTVPMTDPTNLDQWLDHIYIYPKNSQIEGEKTVVNADDLVVGDDITWTINVDIPRVENPDYAGAGSDQFIATDYFRIDDTLQDDELQFVSATLSIGDTELTEGVHYDITPVPSDPAGETTYQILFREEGRNALAVGVNADPSAQVTVDLVTTVLKATDITNGAVIYPNLDSEAESNPLPITGTTVYYGSALIHKLSSDDTVVDLSGAEFQLYTTEEAAKTLNEEFRVTPTDNEGVEHSSWITNADGEILIEGLRYTANADGDVFDSADSRYQTYWLVEVKALDGHQLLAEPIEIVIDSESVSTAIEIVNQANTGGFVLPLTGGQGTALLTVGGIAILAAVLLIARRRQDDLTA